MRASLRLAKVQNEICGCILACDFGASNIFFKKNCVGSTQPPIWGLAIAKKIIAFFAKKSIDVCEKPMYYVPNPERGR